MLGKWTAAAIGVAALVGRPAAGAEKAFNPKAVPPSARHAASKAAPGVKWAEALLITEGGTTT